MATAFSCSAVAQTVPSVGQVLESVRELRTVPPRPDAEALQFSAPRPASPATALPVGADEARVRVNAFTLRGNTVFSDAELLPLIQDGVGRELTLAGIEQIISRISDFYRAQGYLLARAYVPAQAIDAGRIEVAVAEGKLGEVKVRRDKSVRLQQDRIDGVLAILRPGAPVHVPTVERALLLLTDLPGMTVSAALQPGASTDAADLIVTVKEGVMPQVSFGMDNYGTSYTGKFRASLGVQLNDVLGVGDALSFQAVHGFSNLTSGRVGYELPVGADGLRLRLSYADLHYSLGKAFEALGIEGDSQIYSAGLLYPLVRSRNLNVNLFGGLERKRLGEKITALGLSTDKVVSSVNVGLSATVQDDLLGGGVTGVSGVLTNGDLSRRSPLDEANDAATARTAGSFTKFNWQAGRVQRLAPQWSLATSLNGQMASGNLDSSEKFFLGGPFSVRAYQIGEAAGDEGVMGSAELRYDLIQPSGMQLIGFVDAGRVRLNAHPYAPGSNHRSQAGAGIGVNWDIKGLGSLRTSYASKFRSRANDLDRSDRQQFWMSLSMQPEALFAIAAPVAALRSSEQSRTVVYGTLDVSLEAADRRGATPAGPRGATQSATPTGSNAENMKRMRSNSSSLGFRGRERLGRGLALWYQAEASVTLDTGDGTIFGRNTGLGLQSSRLGTVMIGLWDTPYKRSTGSLDPFSGRNFGSFYAIVGSPGFGVGTATQSAPVTTATSANNDDATFIRRQGNGLQYWSPKIGSFSGRVMYSGENASIAADSGEASIWSTALTYDNGPLEITAAYERHDNYYGIASLGRNNRGVGSTAGPASQTTSKDDALKLSFGYDFGATKVGFIVEKLRYRENGVIPAITIPDLQYYERNAAWIGVSHKIDNFTLKGSYGIADRGKCTMIAVNAPVRECDTEGLGAQMLAVGVEYRFSKRTAAYAQYAQINNRASASYNFSPGGVFGAGVGADPRAIGIGMIHRF